MEIGTGISHIRDILGSIEPVKNVRQFLSMSRLNALLGAVIKEVFQAFVAK